MLRRVLQGQEDATLVSIGGDSRNAVSFPIGKTVTLALGRPVGGELLTALALGGDKTALRPLRQVTAVVRVQAQERTLASCMIETPALRLAKQWVPCKVSFENANKATLTLVAAVRIHGKQPSELSAVLAEPILLPQRWTKPQRVGLIVFILLDTLRADHLSLYGYRRPIGTHLASLAKDGILFKQARAPSSWTRTSVASLLTGLSPLSHQVMGRSDRMGNQLVSLPEILQDRGYLTAGWSTNPNVLALWGFAQGFDRFTDLDAEGWVRKATDARQVFRAARTYLNRMPRNSVFLYLHVMDPHAPYIPPKRALQAVLAMPAIPLPATLAPDLDSSDLREKRDRYDAEILYTDTELGRFLDWLRVRNLYKEALIVVVGDHGEEFGEHGGLHHGKTLYEEVLRIPLIIKLPDNRFRGSVVGEPAGLEDIAPTVVALLGDKSGERFEGRSLLAYLEDGEQRLDVPRFASIVLDSARLFSVTVNERKFILGRKGLGMLFDLERDPHETINLTPRQPGTAAEMRSLIEREIAQRSTGWHFKACGAADPSSIKVVLKSPDRIEKVTRIGWEEADQLTINQDRTQVIISYNLQRRSVVVESFGQIKHKKVTDEDEVLLTFASQGSAIMDLLSQQGSPIPYRLGSSTTSGRERSVNLSPRDPTVVAPASVEHPCPVDQSVLLVWYVAPPDTVATDSLPPELLQRLRHLGYL